MERVAANTSAKMISLIGRLLGRTKFEWRLYFVRKGVGLEYALHNKSAWGPLLACSRLPLTKGRPPLASARVPVLNVEGSVAVTPGIRRVSSMRFRLMSGVSSMGWGPTPTP